MTLQLRISLLVIAGLLLVFGTLGAIIFQEQHQAAHQILGQRLMAARTVARSVDKTLNHLLHMTQEATRNAEC